MSLIKTIGEKKVVNIISYISLFGVAIGTAALVVVLSVFAGLENLILDMYNSFDPEGARAPDREWTSGLPQRA